MKVVLLGHQPGGDGHPAASGPAQIIAGIVAGFVIGVVASLGVAGGGAVDPHAYPAFFRRRHRLREACRWR